MSEKDKGTVNLSPDSEYLRRIRETKGASVPVGGVPMPQMPRFDQPPPDRHAGVQAAAQRAAMMPSGVLTPEQAAELQARGQFIPGVGSGYAVNQPGTTKDMGSAMPPTQFVNPPRPEGGLRQETKEQLEAVAKANTEEKKKEETPEDDLDFDQYTNAIKTLQNNKERRKAIESRCEDMNFDDLLVHREVRQRVPIIPSKFEPTFRSPNASEDLFVSRTLGTERASAVYLQDKLSVMHLTCGLFALNGRELPSHLNRDGDVDEKAFDEKYKYISKLPLSIIADLSLNYTWFGERVSRLSVVDQIKGF